MDAKTAPQGEKLYSCHFTSLTDGRLRRSKGKRGELCTERHTALVQVNASAEFIAIWTARGKKELQRSVAASLELLAVSRDAICCICSSLVIAQLSQGEGD
jgi:hypothetical protein